MKCLERVEPRGMDPPCSDRSFIVHSPPFSAWAVGLSAHKAKRDGKPLAPRSVWNTFFTVKVLLDDAVELHRLERNPLATFRADRYLPASRTRWTAGGRRPASTSTRSRS